jgi:hypothetical protein
MIAENALYTVISAGVEWFQDDSRRVEAFFVKCGLTATEAAKMRTYFDRDPAAGEHGGPPAVIHSYPRETGPFPCYAITLAGDPFQQTYLGDDADDELLDETLDTDDYNTDLDGNVARELGHILTYQIDVETYAQHSPDICRYLYHMLRQIMFSSVLTLNSLGFSQVEYVGREINPIERALPENTWLRVLRVTMIGEEKTWETLGRGTTIGSAYVEGSEEDLRYTDDEANDDPDAVQGGIVPYSE